MNTAVLSTLLGRTIDDAASVIKQGWQGTRPFMTGCLINTDDVFSICTGTVVDIGQDNKNNLYSVTIEYNYSTWIRYCLLQFYEVAVGDQVVVGTKIGTTYKGVLRFEYCSDTFSVFPYRQGTRQLYKHDPMPVLTGEIALPEVDDSGDILAIGEDDFMVYVDEDTSDGEVE